MLVLTPFVGANAWLGLGVPTLTALVLGALVAGVFRGLAGCPWGLLLCVLLGGTVGVVNLYVGSFLFSLPLAVASYPYFDFTNLSHWQELLYAPLVLTGLSAVGLLVFPVTAMCGAFIWKRLQRGGHRDPFDNFNK